MGGRIATMIADEVGDHSFKPRKKSGRTEEQNLACAAEALVSFIGRCG